MRLLVVQERGVGRGVQHTAEALKLAQVQLPPEGGSRVWGFVQRAAAGFRVGVLFRGQQAAAERQGSWPEQKQAPKAQRCTEK